MDTEEEVCFYAVRSKDGLYFRAKGYNGTGESWVKDITKARIYARIGPAQAMVSFFTNHYSDYEAPDLVKLSIHKIEIIDQNERIKKIRETKKERDRKAAIKEREYRIRLAEQELAEAKINLEKLKNKP